MKEKILLSFKKKKKWFLFFGEKEITLNYITATTNIAIFGGTGTGKTTSICYPLLHNLIFNGCCGLILDVKGDYSDLSRKINYKKKRVRILGIKEDCEKFNLISNINSSKLKAFFQDALYDYNCGTDSGYWGMNGLEDTILLYELLKELIPYNNPTLADLYYFLVNHDALKKICLQINGLDSSGKQKIIERIYSDNFSIFNFDCKSDSVNEQRTWQISKILKVLKPFYEDPLLRHHFCNNEYEVDYEDIIYNYKNSITVELPTSMYNETSTFCLKIIKSSFIDTIKNRNKHLLRIEEYGEKIFTFMLIDEYQQFINPISTPATNDNNWFDISRGYGHINIISTQSIDSLIAKSNENHVYQLIGNTRNIIHLSTNAQYSLNHINLISSNKIKNKLLFQVEDCAYFYIGKDQISRKGYCSLIYTGKSRLNFMNLYLKNKIELIDVDNTYLKNIKKYNTNKYLIHNIFLNNILSMEIKYKNTGNNIWDKTENPIKIIDKNVSIITSCSKSEGFQDFNLTIKNLGIDFKEVNVYSVIHKNKLSYDIYNNKDGISIFKKNSLILYIRGGGDMENCFLHEEEHINLIKQTVSNKNITIGIGYGHAIDQFELFRSQTAQIWGITPTELAYKINKFY